MFSGASQLIMVFAFIVLGSGLCGTLYIVNEISRAKYKRENREWLICPFGRYLTVLSCPLRDVCGTQRMLISKNKISNAKMAFFIEYEYLFVVL